MFKSPSLKAALALAGLLAFSAPYAAEMSRDQAKAEKDRIEADYKAARDACDKMSGNAKDVCVEQAKGKQKVAKAELDYKQSGKDSDRSKVAMAKAEADYEVAKEKCDELKGDAKDVCVKDAKAAQTKAKADAKANKEVAEARKDAAEARMDARKDATEARKDAAEARADARKDATAARKDAMDDKRDADYKAAIQRCDSMSGDAKASCVASAKAQHGKS